VATIDPDGYMHITDRSKDVIKSGGEWISSIEIENIAVSHPAVAMAACIAARHPKWDERPLLVVMKKADAEVSREELLAHYDGKVAKLAGAGRRRVRRGDPARRDRQDAQGQAARAVPRLQASDRLEGLRDHAGLSRACDARSSILPRRSPEKRHIQGEKTMNRRHAVRWLNALIVGAAGSLLATGAMAQARGAASKASPAPATQTVKIAYIDPLSGPFAGVGSNLLKHFQFSVDAVNARQLAGPGVKFEMVSFDNKASPQETLTVLKQVIDQGIRYVVQGNRARAPRWPDRRDEKHNERNPSKEIVYLNYAAVDPDLTNSKCSFWHFRFDANTDMKMEALTTYMKDRPK
jgi:hypothetical protein